VQHELAPWRPTTISQRLRWLLRGRQQRPSAGHTSMNDMQPGLERFSRPRRQTKLLQLVTHCCWAVARRWRCLSPGVAGVAFWPIPVILWGSVIFQNTLKPPLPGRGARKRESSTASLVNNLGGMLTLKSYAQKALGTPSDRLLKRTPTGAATAARDSSSRPASFPLIRFAILFAFVRILVIAPAGPGEERNCHRSLTAFWYSSPAGCSGRSPTWAANPRRLPSWAMASSARCSKPCSPPMGIPSGDRPLPLQRSEKPGIPPGQLRPTAAAKDLIEKTSNPDHSSWPYTAPASSGATRLRARAPW